MQKTLFILYNVCHNNTSRVWGMPRKDNSEKCKSYMVQFDVFWCSSLMELLGSDLASGGENTEMGQDMVGSRGQRDGAGHGREGRTEGWGGTW